MNLYRSFGNLMEAWVTEENQSQDSTWLGNNYEDPQSPSSNLRSESVDSGVETASSVMSFPATPSSVSMDNAEIDIFNADREGDRLTPASTSQSPEPNLHPGTAQVGSAALHSILEKALQKSDHKHPKTNREPVTVDGVLKRRPRPSFAAKRHVSDLVRGQRSENTTLKRTVNLSAPTRQMLEKHRRPMSMDCEQPAARSENLSEEEATRLSPGLYYLEQVCQMLEEIARQQMHSRALQMEMDALQEHEDMDVSQALDTCQRDTKAAEEDLSSCQRFWSFGDAGSAVSSARGSQRSRDDLKKHFRQRSASDTNLSKLHLKKMNANCRGQHLSTDDLLEREEEHHETQESGNEEKIKTNRNWLNFGSLSKVESAEKETKSKQTQSSEKNSARRRLSQLFKRRKTLPM